MANPLTLFSWGYWGWGAHTRQLLRLSAAVEADRGYKAPLFVDIRVRRSVRAEGFRGDNFERLAGRSRYFWLRDLGNQSIIDGGRSIRIRRPEAAEELLDLAIDRARNRQRIIFFCSCELPCGCHRSTVAGLLIAQARRLHKPLRVVEWPGGEASENVTEIAVPSADLRKFRRSLSGLTLPRSFSWHRAAELPGGSLVRAVAKDEEPVNFAAAAVSPAGGKWYLPVMWNEDSIVKANREAAMRWCREYGYGPRQYQPTR